MLDELFAIRSLPAALAGPPPTRPFNRPTKQNAFAGAVTPLYQRALPYQDQRTNWEEMRVKNEKHDSRHNFWSIAFALTEAASLTEQCGRAAVYAWPAPFVQQSSSSATLFENRKETYVRYSFIL